MEDDAQLLEAWRDGEQRAGRILFERYYDPLARFFRNKVGAEAPDLVQRTFLGCVEGLDRFRGEGSFRSYLFAVAYRQLCKHYRDESKQRERFDVGTVTAYDLDPTPSRALARRREQRLLLEALRRIPVEFQVALELHYWEQMPAYEIAAALDCPVGTMKSRIRRGRQMLGEQLEQLATSPAELKSTMGNIDDWAVALRAEILGADE